MRHINRFQPAVQKVLLFFFPSAHPKGKLKMQLQFLSTAVLSLLTLSLAEETRSFSVYYSPSRPLCSVELTLEPYSVRIVQENNPCSTSGWYCFQNGQDWAGCNTDLGLVTNDQFKIVDDLQRCTPGQYMAALS
jgi:hypothetical protein